ncbi:MAG: hypothetical protein QXM00_08770 [Candidatus Bathyarchaeia archaeon]
MKLMAKEKLCIPLLLLTVITSFIIKFNALCRYEIPPSPDYGNYLVQVDVLRGYDIRGFGLQYPPVYFILLDLILRLFDEFTALKLMASIVFSIAAIPFFLLVKVLTTSSLSALISTWFFIFFEGYSEMIAWGGNPNFLGFSFILLTLLFLERSLKNPVKKNILLTGFFLSLSVGTHLLVTAFMLTLIPIFILLNIAFNMEKGRNTIKILFYSSSLGVIFSLPYSTTYFNCLKHFSADLIRLNFIRQLSEFQSSFTWMFRETYVIDVIIAILDIFALAKYMRENKTSGLLLCSLFLAPILLALSTAHPSRWLYFLPIPLFACFGIYLKKSLANNRGSITGKRCFPPIVYLVILLALGAGATTFLSVNRLNVAIDYYQTIGDKELEALKWIRENTLPNSLFITSGPTRIERGGNSYSWWVEGYSKRKCIPAADPEFFSYLYERIEVDFANHIFAGRYAFDCGPIQVSENFPSGGGNPMLAALINSQYQKILFLNDAEMEITLSPKENKNVTLREVPFHAEKKIEEIRFNETWLNATFIYTWQHLIMYRSIMAGSGQSYLNVIFRISPVNASIKLFNINFRSPPYMQLEEYRIDESAVYIRQRTPLNRIIKLEIAVQQSNAEINYIKLNPKDSNYSMPLISFSLKPRQKDLYLALRVSIDASGSPDSANQKLKLYDSHELIRNLKVKYVLIDKNRADEYYRFLLDPENFTPVFQNERITIFRVNSDHANKN